MSNYNRKEEDLSYAVFIDIYKPGSSTPSFETLKFTSISLTNFEMSMSPQWTPEKAGGRADPLYRYEQFTRDINLSFQLLAYKPKDHDNNYRDLNILAASTMPVYDRSGNNGNGYNGCIIKIFVGSQSKQLVEGYALIENLRYSWNDSFPWKVAESTLDFGGPPSIPPSYLSKKQAAPVSTDVSLSLKMLSTNNGERYALGSNETANNLFKLKQFI